MRKATRYVSTLFLSSLFFVFGSFGILYILIDYSLNIKHFLNNSASFSTMLLYFLSCYLMRFDFFLILSLLFATLYTIFYLKRWYELLAFQAGGISLKRLFAPVIRISFLSFLLMLAFYQYVYPRITEIVTDFQQNTLKKGSMVYTTPQARSIQLEDGTTIFFTHIDPDTGMLQNAYIFSSLEKCWFCSAYDPHMQKGYHVGLLLRGKEGFEYDGIQFNEYDFSKELPLFSPSHWGKRYHKALPLREIYEKMKHARYKNVRMAHESNFMYKISISFIGALLLPIILGYAKSFHRKESIGILFATTFAGFMCLYMMCISCKILGEEELFSTLYSLPILLGILTTFSFRSYVRL